jgi:hypothetical protein
MAFIKVWEKDFTGVANTGAGAAMALVGGIPATGAANGPLIDFVGGQWSVAGGKVVNPNVADAPLVVPVPPAHCVRITTHGKQGDQAGVRVNLRALDGGEADGRGTELIFSVAGAGASVGVINANITTFPVAALAGFVDSITQLELIQYADGIRVSTMRVWTLSANILTDAPVYTDTKTFLGDINVPYAIEIGSRITEIKKLTVETQDFDPVTLSPGSLFPASFPELTKLAGTDIVGLGQYGWADSILAKPVGVTVGTVTMERSYPAIGTDVSNVKIKFANGYGNESVLPTGNLIVESSLILPTLLSLPPGVAGIAMTGGGFLLPFQFTGGDRGIITPGNFGVGEIANFILPFDMPYKLRYYLEGAQIPAQSSYTNGLSNTLQVAMTGANVARNPGTATALGLVAGWGDPSPCPAALLGIPAQGLSSTAVIGDSKAGYIHPKLQSNNKICIPLNMPGDTIGNVAGFNGRMRRAIAYFANNLIVQMGINDLGNQIKGVDLVKKLLYILDAESPKTRIILCTIDSKTTSTDGWLTVQNQAFVRESSPNSEVQEYNNFVRRFSAFFDITKHTMDTITGKWKAGFTIDGVHYTATGIIAAQLGIDLSLLYTPPVVSNASVTTKHSALAIHLGSSIVTTVKPSFSFLLEMRDPVTGMAISPPVNLGDFTLYEDYSGIVSTSVSAVVNDYEPLGLGHAQIECTLLGAAPLADTSFFLRGKVVVGGVDYWAISDCVTFDMPAPTSIAPTAAQNAAAVWAFGSRTLSGGGGGGGTGTSVQYATPPYTLNEVSTSPCASCNCRSCACSTPTYMPGSTITNLRLKAKDQHGLFIDLTDYVLSVTLQKLPIRPPAPNSTLPPVGVVAPPVVTLVSDAENGQMIDIAWLPTHLSTVGNYILLITATLGSKTIAFKAFKVSVKDSI